MHGLVVQTTLDPAAQPFLDHHRIDGTAVLPGVMGMEAFAEVARLLAPDWHVVAVEDVDFRAPLKFYRDEPRTLTVTALLRPDGADLVAECRLAADRMLPGSDEPQRTVYFTGSVRLRTRATATPRRPQPVGARGGRAGRGPRGRLPAVLPRAGLPGRRGGLAGRRGGGRPARRRPAAQPRAGGSADRPRPPAGGAVLPDGRAVGGRPDRSARRCPPTSGGSCWSAHARPTRRPAGRTRWRSPVPARQTAEASTAPCSTATAG